MEIKQASMGTEFVWLLHNAAAAGRVDLLWRFQGQDDLRFPKMIHSTTCRIDSKVVAKRIVACSEERSS